LDGILSSVVKFWDEEPVGPMDSGNPTVEHSWSSVCLTGH